MLPKAPQEEEGWRYQEGLHLSSALKQLLWPIEEEQQLFHHLLFEQVAYSRWAMSNSAWHEAQVCIVPENHSMLSMPIFFDIFADPN